MDTKEASEILDVQLRKYRSLEYSQLKKFVELDKASVIEITGKSGTKYQVELQAFWDDKPDGDLRVMLSIDDGGLRAFKPLSKDLIISSSNRFIGE